MKKQFRLFDIYQYIATGEQSVIKGIEGYSVRNVNGNYSITVELSSIIVIDNTLEPHKVSNVINRYCATIDQMKTLIKEVNRKLGNCQRPGKKVKK